MITSHLAVGLAQAKIDDFRRTADARGLAHRRAGVGRTVAAERSVTLRLGSPGDAGALARLATLDSSTPRARPVLLADAGGQLVAALGLSDGRVVADRSMPRPI